VRTTRKYGHDIAGCVVWVAGVAPQAVKLSAVVLIRCVALELAMVGDKQHR
jgi:hypothetical protein